jgi:hypothetical protein
LSTSMQPLHYNIKQRSVIQVPATNKCWKISHYFQSPYPCVLVSNHLSLTAFLCFVHFFSRQKNPELGKRLKNPWTHGPLLENSHPRSPLTALKIALLFVKQPSQIKQQNLNNKNCATRKN